MPGDWQRAVIVPLYEGKGIRSSKNYKGISPFSIPRKLYTRVVINRVREQTNGAIEEEQNGFEEECGCADQNYCKVF